MTEKKDLYKLYYKIAFEVNRKNIGTGKGIFVDTTFETALEFAKQYALLTENEVCKLEELK